MSGCGSCKGNDDCGSDCGCGSSCDYIAGYSVFDRREEKLTQEDVECDFAIGDRVYNPNTFEHGVIDGYKKMLGSTYVLFKITKTDGMDKLGNTLFSVDNEGKKYYVEPCFINIDKV